MGTPASAAPVRSYSGPVFGRCISAWQNHHWVVDHSVELEGPGEMPGTIEYFFSGLTSCAVLLIERYAHHHAIPLTHINVSLEAERMDPAKRPEGPAGFEWVRMHLEFQGPDQAQAEELVGEYKRR